MCHKEHWDTDGPNAKATEPGRGQERRILNLKNEDKGESPMMANPYPSHNSGYTKTKECPVQIQQSKNDGMRMTRARYSEELPLGVVIINKLKKEATM